MKKILQTILFSSLSIAITGISGAAPNTNIKSMINVWDKTTPGYHNIFTLTGTVHSVSKSPQSTTSTAAFVIDDGELLISVFNETKPLMKLQAGERIVAAGIFGLKKQIYGNEPYAVAHTIKIIGRGSPIHPVERPLRDLSNFSDNLRLIQTSGTIIDWRASEEDPLWMCLTLKDGPMTMPILIPSIKEEDVNSLLESRVSLVGTFHWALASVRRYARPLIVSRFSDIKITAPPAADIPFLERKIYLTPEKIRSLGRRKIRGEIIAVWQRYNLLLRDDDGRIVRVKLSHRNTSSPHNGYEATICGYPETDQFNFILDTATIFSCTKKKTASTQTSRVLSLNDVISRSPSGSITFNTSCYGMPAILEGTIQTLPSLGNAEGRIGLDCNGYLIELDTSACPEATDGLNLGCKVKATGVCLLETNDYDAQTDMPHISALTLIVREKNDIAVISHPPWLTSSRFIIIISTMTGILILFLIWNTSLRIMVERRGRELARKQIEATNARFKTIERTRLATELHDSVVQNLTGAAMEIRAAQAALQEKDKDSAPHLDIALKTINSSRAELRNCIWDLRNEALEKNDIEESIRITLRPHLPESQLLIRFCVPRRKIPDNVFHNILCIIRELVVNAVRHGQAKRIKITGSLDKDRLIFSVSDNGVGFDPHNRPGMEQGHFGIEGVMERVKSLDGGIDITSALGDGTSVTVKIPIHQDA